MCFQENTTLEDFLCSPVFFLANHVCTRTLGWPYFFKQLVAQLCSEEYLASTGDRAGVKLVLCVSPSVSRVEMPHN